MITTVSDIRGRAGQGGNLLVGLPPIGKTQNWLFYPIRTSFYLIFHWQYSNTKWGLSADDDENEWKDDWEQNILDQNCLTFNLLV